MPRIFFCTDLHGSEVCFRKMLHAPEAYDASIVIMGGDCTGKMMVPVVESNQGAVRCEWAGVIHECADGEESAKLERRIRDSGLYPVRMDQNEHQRLLANPEAREALFKGVMLETLKGWVATGEERLAGKGVRLIMTPGNDDEFSVDDVLRASSFVETGDGKILDLGDGHQMLSLSWSNPTPWDTPRECSEEKLAGMIDDLAAQLDDVGRSVFNIHVPPLGSGLDLAPELDDEGQMVRGGAVLASVGSSAVLEAIERHQPLLSLHGHIHESRAIQRIGRTVAINPGSSYGDGSLQGVIVDLKGGKVKRYVPVTG
jgi:Icc-related predicted phosphoesterase